VLPDASQRRRLGRVPLADGAPAITKNTAAQSAAFQVRASADSNQCRRSAARIRRKKIVANTPSRSSSARNCGAMAMT
jgi:hypothetical protein